MYTPRAYEIVREFDMNGTESNGYTPIASGRCSIRHIPTNRAVVFRSNGQVAYWPNAAAAGNAAIHFSENTLDAQFILEPVDCPVHDLTDLEDLEAEYFGTPPRSANSVDDLPF